MFVFPSSKWATISQQNVEGFGANIIIIYPDTWYKSPSKFQHYPTHLSGWFSGSPSDQPKQTDASLVGLSQASLLLMEEILQHLGCIKPVNNGIGLGILHMYQSTSLERIIFQNPCTSPGSGPATATPSGLNLSQGWALKNMFCRKKSVEVPANCQRVTPEWRVGIQAFCWGWGWIREFFGRKGTISLGQNCRKILDKSLILRC